MSEGISDLKITLVDFSLPSFKFNPSLDIVEVNGNPLPIWLAGNEAVILFVGGFYFLRQKNAPARVLKINDEIVYFNGAYQVMENDKP